MSKTIKALIAGIAAVVLLTGGILAMKFTEPEPEEADPSVVEENSELSVYDGNADDITSIDVKNNSGGYTLVRTHRAAEGTESNDVSTYNIKGMEKYNLDASLVGALPQNAASLTAQKLIEENSADLSRYGLDSPKSEATIVFDGDNAKTVKVLIGNDTPAGDVYMMLDGGNTVYSISKTFADAYSYEKEYFVSHVCIEKPADEDCPIVNSVTVERKDLDYDIVLTYDPNAGGSDEKGGTTATHVMTSPVNAYLDVNNSVDYTHSMFGLTASNVLSLSPSEKELEVAGINDPLCTVTTVLENGTKYVLKIGIRYDSEGGQAGYTGYLEGTDILWQFAENNIPWVNMKPEDAMSSLVFGSYVYSISSLTIVTENETKSFMCTGTESETYAVTLNGKDFDKDRFVKFYQALIKAPAEEICLSEEGMGKRIAAFLISHNDGTPDESIEFFETDSRKVLIRKNGVMSFACRSSFAEKALIPNIENLEGDSSFVTNW